MSKTHRSDGPLIAGFHHSGDRGLGLRGGDIPATGAHGPAIPYPSLTFPTHTEAEVMIRILTVPAALTYFTVDELGRVAAEGPPGAHVGTFRLWLDGVDNGTSTYSVLIGPSGALSGSALVAAVASSGTLSGSVPTSGVLSGNGIIDPVRGQGNLTGTLTPSGALGGNAQLGGVLCGGALEGVFSSGALGGNAQVAAVANGGVMSAPLPFLGPIKGRAYAKAAAYIARFGLEEAAQLLSDEERLLTPELLEDAVTSVFRVTPTPPELRAAIAALARLERHLTVTSNFMDGYLRSVATLPLDDDGANSGTLEECCLALTRFGIADDADNATERIDEAAKTWRAWLRDVARGTVQLVGRSGVAAPSRGRTRVGQTKGGIDFGGFGKVR